MYKEILRSVAGIGLFPVISLVLFVAVFAVAVIRAMCMDRAGVQYLAGLPLQDDQGPARATEAREGTEKSAPQRNGVNGGRLRHLQADVTSVPGVPPRFEPRTALPQEPGR